MIEKQSEIKKFHAECGSTGELFCVISQLSHDTIFSRQIIVRFYSISCEKKLDRGYLMPISFDHFEISWIRCRFAGKYWLLLMVGFMRKTSPNGFQTVLRSSNDKNESSQCTFFNFSRQIFEKHPNGFANHWLWTSKKTSEWVIWNDHVDSCHWFIGHALNVRTAERRDRVHNSREFAVSSVQSDAFHFGFALHFSAIDASPKWASRSSVYSLSLVSFWFHGFDSRP